MRTHLTKLLALAVLAVGACVAPYTHRVSPVVRLTEVERPASTREQWGPQVLSTVEDSGVTRYSFEDNMILARFVVGEDEVLFDLKNKTDHSIRLLWTETTMVLPDGSVSPVMMTGWKYSECRNEKPPAVIPRGVTIDDLILPCSKLYLGSTWSQMPLFQDGAEYAYDSTLTETVGRVRTRTSGKRLSILMPLQIEGVTNEYTFTFGVDSVHVRRLRGANGAPLPGTPQ